MNHPRVIARHLQPVIAQRLAEEPVVILTGARTVGKSTLLTACSREHGVPVTDLDDIATRRAVAADPTLFTSGRAEPVCLDEFQHVPVLLDAIKAELNRDLRPGRFLLTGSTRYNTMPKASQSLTGRAHIMTMWPLSQGELRGRKETFLDDLVTDPGSLTTPEPSRTDRASYEQMVLAGGFPLAIARSAQATRDQWFRDFVDMVIERDVLEIRRVRQRRVLPLILRHLAAQTAGVLNVSSIAATVQLDGRLVGDFVSLLESVFLVHQLEAFGRTLGSRVGRMPKVHLVDSGLAAYLLGINDSRLAARDPSTLTEFGHVVETFAINELIKQAGWSSAQVRFAHFRTRDGYEVDLVAETAEGKIAGLEIKASATITDSDFRGMRLLRGKLGTDFLGGVLLNLGQRSYTYEDRLHVIPLDRLWT
ncbi:MAG: ATP-binding protein [Streptosporangiaceae bacterium]